MFSNPKVVKSRRNFGCEICDYKSCRKFDYDKHIQTEKHKSVSSAIISNQKTTNTFFTCICGKSYQDNSGLWRHKKKCHDKLELIHNYDGLANNEIISNSSNDNDASLVNISNDTLIELLKQNNEFKELLVEQSKMIIDLSSKPNTTINNTMNNTINNKFNLNVFLNETCKDAININDFVKSLQITSADFERFGKNGFVEGISNIMLKGLNKLEVCKRPIHCSDLKRETIHLKEDNGWAKETNDGSKLKKVIKQIKHKNIDYTDAWKDENPEYKDFESKVHERYMKIINESMGGYNNEEDEVFYNKIIKNVAKETVIKK